MIETLEAPDAPRDGQVRCPGCRALLRYAGTDLKQWKPEWVGGQLQQMQLGQMTGHFRKPHVASRDFYLPCPHCASEVIIG